MKILNYFFQSLVVYLFFIIGRLIGLNFSRKIFATIFITFGNFFKSKKIITKNLNIISNKVPGLDEKLISKDMWKNYGMTFIEYIFLNYFRKKILIDQSKMMRIYPRFYWIKNLSFSYLAILQTLN